MCSSDLPTGVLAPDFSSDPAACPAVAGGNVETSQRVVDVLLGALAGALPDRVPAASQGTMNNLALGGIRRDGRPFTYYETVAGGAGAHPRRAGADGIHTHMTNSLNTPIEALERELPVRVRRYGFRRGSGGAGKWTGGNGLVREIEALAPLEGTLLAERRASRPYGLAGGAPGAAGSDRIVEWGEKERPIPAKGAFRLTPGDRLIVETPGGGGWGAAGIEPA